MFPVPIFLHVFDKFQGVSENKFLIKFGSWETERIESYCGTSDLSFWDNRRKRYNVNYKILALSRQPDCHVNGNKS